MNEKDIMTPKHTKIPLVENSNKGDFYVYSHHRLLVF